jgi:hypothetical protein
MILYQLMNKQHHSSLYGGNWYYNLSFYREFQQSIRDYMAVVVVAQAVGLDKV